MGALRSANGMVLNCDSGRMGVRRFARDGAGDGYGAD